MPKSFGNRSFMRPIGRLSLHSRCLVFFKNVFGGKEEDFFHFPFVQQVPNLFSMGFLLSFFGGWGERGRFFSFSLCSNRFPMCSPWVFPIAPCFKFCSKSSHSRWAKGEALHLSIESSIFVSLHSFNFFLSGPIKFNKKRLDF